MLVYHLTAGIITLFAVVQTDDGKSFVGKLHKESHYDDCLSGMEKTVRWGAYLCFSVALWIVAWPLITLAWSIARIVKPSENAETETAEN